MVGLLTTVGWLAFNQWFDHNLADQVNQSIGDSLEERGLRSHVGDARFVEGQGLRLNNVRINLLNESSIPGQLRTNLDLYELFVHSDATIADLATNNLRPHAIEIKRARLTLVRLSDGTWDFESLLDHLVSFKNPESEFTPVVLRDCEIEIIDRSKPTLPSVLISSIDFSVHKVMHEGRALIQVLGKFRTKAVSEVQVTAYVDQVQSQWHCELSATDAMIAQSLLRLIPKDVQQTTNELKSLSGKLSFSAVAQGKLPNGGSIDESMIPRFTVSGQVQQLSIDDSRLPVPVRDANATFSISNDGINVTEATGRIGDQSTFRLNYTQAGLISSQGWHLDGNVKQFYFSDRARIRRWLPEYCRDICDDYSPEGMSNIDFDLTYDGQKLHQTVKGYLTDMAFSYVKLPYQLDHCSGIVEIIDDRCTFDVRSSVGREPVRLHGFVKDFVHAPIYQVNIAVPGTLPIDQKMMDAASAQPKLAEVIHAFNAQGRVGGLGRIERRMPNGTVERSYDVRLQGCSVRHNSFDFPIFNVEGLVIVRGSEYTFQDLKGANGSGVVRCNGSLKPESGLSLRFLCDSVPLSDELKFALKPEIRQIWSGFRPRGTLDFLRVDLTRLPGDSKTEIGLEATLKSSMTATDSNSVSIHPVWFPYRINHLRGTVKLAKGQIQLTDFSGNHQKTNIACQGVGHYSDQSWSLRLKDLFVSSLKVDDDLLAAVPPALAPTLKSLGYQGLMNVSGIVTLAGDKRNSKFRRQSDSATLGHRKPRTSLAWDIGVNMSQAKMKLGLPVENVFGALNLIGLFDGTRVECNGRVDIDSMTIHGTQITNVQGPLRIENGRVFAGSFARQRKLATDHLSPVASSGPSPSLTGNLHKGRISFDAQLDSSNNNEFYFQAKLDDSCLETACREWAPDFENVEGSSFAEIRMRGDGTGTHSNRGVGSIQLLDAKIYELPIFLSLLKILKVRQPNRTAFDSGQIEFTVQGETLIFDRMEFNGDAISLIGNGQMNFDRDIELDFYSMMGRNRVNIPLITNLVRAGSQQVLHISVDGTLDAPKMHRQVLPQLSELRQLFQNNRPSSIRRDPMIGTASAEIPIGKSYFDSRGTETKDIGLQIK